MNTLLEQLHDIEGLDPISWWPLAIGWWILLAAGIVIACAVIFLAVYWLAYKRSWKNDTFKRLRSLEENLSDSSANKTLITLSDYLRRIALRRFSRKECASLTGEAWLKWLSKHDPKNFDWEKEGVLLMDAPYAPSNAHPSTAKIKELICAVKHWIK